MQEVFKPHFEMPSPTLTGEVRGENCSTFLKYIQHLNFSMGAT